ncbi:MAG: CPBP family intramembrane metalloprotease [Clostridia bacterium]|nr:CPBP family intramembrane metalloprotease [Clostridia bacterium]
MKSQKNKFAEWMNEHPILAGFVVVILYTAFRKGLYYLFLYALPQTFAFTVIHEVLDVIWPFLMVVAFGRLNVYRRGGFFRTLFLGTTLLLYGLLFGFVSNLIPLFKESGVEWQTPFMMIWAAVTMFFVGFREESCYRGIVLHIFADKYLKDRRGILITAFASAAFFGIMHMNNIFVGQSFLECVVQTVNAFFLGALFGAVLLRGGNLWSLMLIHGFIDLGLTSKNLLTKTYASDAVGYIASHTKTTIDPIETVIRLILWAVIVCITLFMLRKSKCDEIIERFNADGSKKGVNE